MRSHELFVQSATQQGVVHRGLIRTALGDRYDSLDACVAYATMKGCQALSESLSDRFREWQTARKRWMISIDWGITEPSALEYLQSLPASTVVVPRATEVLASKLRPRVCFHSKMYALRSADGRMAVYSTSANLTLSGLYLNDEQATATIWKPPFSSVQKKALRAMNNGLTALDDQYAAAEPLTPTLLEEYRKIRPSRPKLGEDRGKQAKVIGKVGEVAGTAKAAAFATAECYWVDVANVYKNRGQAIPGNQIDLQRGSRLFFGFADARVHPNYIFGPVDITYDGQTTECNMRFGDNQMDKLNLPIPGDGGPTEYDNQTLLFCHATGGGSSSRSALQPRKIDGNRSRGLRRHPSSCKAVVSSGSFHEFNLVMSRVIPDAGRVAPPHRHNQRDRISDRDW